MSDTPDDPNLFRELARAAVLTRQRHAARVLNGVSPEEEGPSESPLLDEQGNLTGPGSVDSETIPLEEWVSAVDRLLQEGPHGTSAEATS